MYVSEFVYVQVCGCVYVQLHVLACMPFSTLMHGCMAGADVGACPHICMCLYVHPKVAEGQCLYKCVDTGGSHLYPPRYKKISAMLSVYESLQWHLSIYGCMSMHAWTRVCTQFSWLQSTRKSFEETIKLKKDGT